MTINRHKQLRLTQVCLLAFVVSAPVVALEESSHRLVSRQAVLSSSSVDLEAYFRETLGLSDGSETFLAPLDGPPRRAREWIELGGELEDRGSPFTGSGRFYKHFHDPLQPWNTAGLTFLGPNESSVRWMQNRDQKSTGAAGGNWSWHDARRMYYQALTEPDPALRQALLAATFRALGQIMHLVVDASVPEHVRDDEHPLGTTPFFWSYDTWIQSRHGSQDESDLFIDRYLSNPIGPDPELFQISIPGSEAANVPIARLIDSDAYSGENPEITFNAAAPSARVAIGLAEIANANFFSEDKFGQGAEPYPPNPRFLEPGLIPVDAPRGTLTPDGRKIVRRYWARPAGQRLLPVNRLRADCVSRFLGTFSEHATRRPCVDGVVWDAVAAQMLPRAVGYARGVLDYFFRGSMRVHALSTDEGGAFIRIENLTDEEMEGVFEIYARLMAGAPDESREQVGLVADGAVTTVSAKATVTLPVTLLPGEHPTASQILVFRGRLGSNWTASPRRSSMSIICSSRRPRQPLP